jgi:5-methylcytosine-specific restriction enzyme subunit McrC
VDSRHLYQLLAYLRAMSFKYPDRVIDGMLVYPVGDSTADLRYHIDGYAVRIYTLNLNQNWNAVEADLLDLLKPLNEEAPAFA